MVVDDFGAVRVEADLLLRVPDSFKALISFCHSPITRMLHSPAKAPPPVDPVILHQLSPTTPFSVTASRPSALEVI